MTVRNSNGFRLHRHVRLQRIFTGGGYETLWGCNVWFGGLNGVGTNERRHYYLTRAQARAADISDDQSNSALVTTGAYWYGYY